MATTYTICSWALIMSLAGLMLYWNYFKLDQTRQTSLSKSTPRIASKEVSRKDGKRSKKSRIENNLQKEHLGQSRTTQIIQEGEVESLQEVGNEIAEVSNNEEFARQLSTAKTGVLPQNQQHERLRVKSITSNLAPITAKDTYLQPEDTSDNATASQAAHPETSRPSVLRGTADSSSLAADSVSDMLGAPSSGPSILRVISPLSSATPKKLKNFAAPEPIETKKQRQNRKKNELKKKGRAEDEKERKTLLEKQRQTVRESEGRTSKSDSVFAMSKPPVTSPWSQSRLTGDENAKAVKSQHTPTSDLLDTFTLVDPIYSKKQQTDDSRLHLEWQQAAESIPEEEQFRRALEDSDKWKTVGKDKKNRKKSHPTPKPNVPTNQHFLKEPPSSDLGSRKYELNGHSQQKDSSKYIQIPHLPQDRSSSFIEHSELHASNEDSEWEVA